MSTSAYFLVGATASGKSAVAQYIAERQGQMIVSADSMNLYRGMDIGTAKPSAEERAKVDYAGINLADPTEKFSVAAYLEALRPAFESGREIIVVGGTGLYIKCLTEGFDDVPPENEDLRTELEALDFESLERRAQKHAYELYVRLTEDDRKNKRRLIRILEREVPSVGKWNSRPKATMVGLRVERQEQMHRIERRVESMYDSGLLGEARKLMKLDLSPTALQAIGYAEAFAVLRNEMTVEKAKEKTIIRTRQLAKRQMTWFRNQLNIEWIDVSHGSEVREIAEEVLVLWKRIGKTPVVF